MIAGQAIGALLCVKYVFNGTFTVGDYVMFGTYIAQLYVPLNMFGCTYKNIQARDHFNIIVFYSVRKPTLNSTG